MIRRLFIGCAFVYKWRSKKIGEGGSTNTGVRLNFVINWDITGQSVADIARKVLSGRP